MAFRPFRALAFRRLAVLGLAVAALGGCTGSEAPKAFKPVPYELVSTMQKLDMKETSRVFVRIFKESSELEVWKETRGGTFALLKTYNICKWSGALGPKKVEGDRQAPEGFYTVTPAQMNPKSSYYLSFNIGYPNAFDRSWGRTGSNLMVHGACSSAGCYSMTDEAAGELFALARDSFRGGQTNFQIQALPFRMTAENLARHRDDPNMEFWKVLKVGSDHFELTLKPPKVDVCDRRYVFNGDAGDASFNASAACPPYSVPEILTAALAKKQAEDEAAILAAMTTLEAKAKAEEEAKQLAAIEAAERVQLAAIEAAEREQRAAERAAQPSIVSRILSRVGIGGEPEADVVTDPAPVASIVPAAAPKAVAAVPPPRTRPAVATPPVASAVPPAETVAAGPPPPAAEPAAATTAVAPPVGKLVKRKFLWPGEDDPEAADAPPG